MRRAHALSRIELGFLRQIKCHKCYSKYYIWYTHHSFKAKNFIEKILWAALGFMGIAWMIYFSVAIVQDENPLIVRNDRVDFKQIEYPAMTICSEMTTKFSLVELLGNYYDPDQELTNELKQLLKEFIDIVAPEYMGLAYSSECTNNADKIGNICEVRMF